MADGQGDLIMAVEQNSGDYHHHRYSKASAYHHNDTITKAKSNHKKKGANFFSFLRIAAASLDKKKKQKKQLFLSRRDEERQDHISRGVEARDAEDSTARMSTSTLNMLAPQPTDGHQQEQEQEHGHPQRERIMTADSSMMGSSSSSISLKHLSSSQRSGDDLKGKKHSSPRAQRRLRRQSSLQNRIVGDYKYDNESSTHHYQQQQSTHWHHAPQSSSEFRVGGTAGDIGDDYDDYTDDKRPVFPSRYDRSSSSTLTLNRYQETHKARVPGLLESDEEDVEDDNDAWNDKALTASTFKRLYESSNVPGLRHACIEVATLVTKMKETNDNDKKGQQESSSKQQETLELVQLEILLQRRLLVLLQENQHEYKQQIIQQYQYRQQQNSLSVETQQQLRLQLLQSQKSYGIQTAAIHRRLARLEIIVGNHDNAMEHIQQALDTKEDAENRHQTLRLQARLLAIEKDWKGAERALDQAILELSLSPLPSTNRTNLVSTSVELASVLERRGDWKRAISVLQCCLKPQDANTYLLATVHCKLGLLLKQVKGQDKPAIRLLAKAYLLCQVADMEVEAATAEGRQSDVPKYSYTRRTQKMAKLIQKALIALSRRILRVESDNGESAVNHAQLEVFLESLFNSNTKIGNNNSKILARSVLASIPKRQPPPNQLSEEETYQGKELSELSLQSANDQPRYESEPAEEEEAEEEISYANETDRSIALIEYSDKVDDEACLALLREECDQNSLDAESLEALCYLEAVQEEEEEDNDDDEEEEEDEKKQENDQKGMAISFGSGMLNDLACPHTTISTECSSNQPSNDTISLSTTASSHHSVKLNPPGMFDDYTVDHGDVLDLAPDASVGSMSLSED